MSDRGSGSTGPLRADTDLEPLLERIGDAHVVMLGEASHGTHEYYAWRATLTRRLITEQGFDFVAVEGDWPDCYQVDRCVRLVEGAADDPRRVLDAFERWPTWMWANEEVVAFTTWLRAHNERRPEQDRAGFYGLDVYSLWESLQQILEYLQEYEPAYADTALRAFRCFEPYREDPQAYALSTRLTPSSCEAEVVALLQRLRSDRSVRPDDGDSAVRFAAEQNAAVVVDAERYYRAMVQGDEESWNVRDIHMADTLDRLLEHHGPEAKAVVWAHNTHVGDARATDMARAGLVNLGQLGRERHGTDDVVLVGFAGFRGSVIAAGSWGAQMERMPLPPARDDSLERQLHDDIGEPALHVFPCGDGADSAPGPAWLREEWPHRAVGVVYEPQRERWGNYVSTVTGDRYDALLFFDDTTALQPLHLEPPAVGEELTYPFAV
jgi:erythromycin esterase-like protein